MTWETVIASLAATFATDVRFEEPDITCTFNGRRFAVAAKIAYSKNKLFENVEDGAKQTRGKADASLVFVDVVELYPQVETLRLSHARAFTEEDDPAAQMRDAVTRWCTRFAIDRMVTRLRTLTQRPVGVAFFVPMYIHALEAPRPFFYTHMPVTWGLDGPDYAFATAFLGACNRVLGFVAPEEAARPI